MKKLIIGISIVLLLVVPLAACARAPESKVVPMPAPSPIPAPSEIAPMPPEREEVYKPGGEGMPSVAEERMIVRTGDMSLVVEDVVDARDRIAQVA